MKKGGFTFVVRYPVRQVKLAILRTERNTDYEPQWELKRRYTISIEISRHNRCTLLEHILIHISLYDKQTDLSYRTLIE